MFLHLMLIKRSNRTQSRAVFLTGEVVSVWFNQLSWAVFYPAKERPGMVNVNYTPG